MWCCPKKKDVSIECTAAAVVNTMHTTTTEESVGDDHHNVTGENAGEETGIGMEMDNDLGSGNESDSVDSIVVVDDSVSPRSNNSDVSSANEESPKHSDTGVILNDPISSDESGEESPKHSESGVVVLENDPIVSDESAESPKCHDRSSIKKAVDTTVSPKRSDSDDAWVQFGENTSVSI